VTRTGKVRLLARLPAFGLLEDISPAGRVLIALGVGSWGVKGLPAVETKEQDLSWLDLSSGAALSADGRVLVGTESGEGTKQIRAIYLRHTDGRSPPLHLGDGFALAVSPDAKWVLSRPQNRDNELVMIPTGAGDSKVFSCPGYAFYDLADWSANGLRVLVTAHQASRPPRSFVLDLDGRCAPVTPEGIVASAISPDGRRVAATDSSGRVLLFRAGVAEPETMPGPPETGGFGPWSIDGKGVYVSSVDHLTMRVFLRDFATGRRTLTRTVAPADPTGLIFVSPLISSDGQMFAYNYARYLSSLYVLNGVK
jgi:hypothetical protein